MGEESIINRGRKLLILLILLCVLFASISCTEKNTSELIEDKDYQLDQLTLGLSYVPDSSDNYTENTLKHLTELNINQVRIGHNWKLREPAIGVYNMEPFINRLDFYEENNIELLITIDIKTIPDWSLELDRDSFLMQFREFVKVTFSECGQNVSVIQLGNEWDWEIDKYLYGDVDLFIDMSNVLYEEVKAMNTDKRPFVALGSISIGGLRILAFNQNRIDNVYFENEPLYTEEEVASYQPLITQTSDRANKIMKECNYDMIDIHLYDDYWNWQYYVDAVRYVLEQVNRNEDIPIIASEFGGPNPEIEPQEDSYRANQLYYYVKTIDDLGISLAYYFKLHEHTAEETIYHPFSYLITKDGYITDTYEVLSKFGEQKNK